MTLIGKLGDDNIEKQHQYIIKLHKTIFIFYALPLDYTRGIWCFCCAYVCRLLRTSVYISVHTSACMYMIPLDSGLDVCKR